METIVVKRLTGGYMLLLPDMDYQDLVVLMQVTQKSLPLVSNAIRGFIEPNTKEEDE